MKNQVAQIDLRQNAWKYVLIRFREEIEIELTFTACSPLSSPTVLLNAQQRGWPPHYHLFIRI